MKTIDLRLLSGGTAVHADMIMWHAQRAGGAGGVPAPEHPVLGAAGLGAAAGDPQGPLRDDAFYIDYWNGNRAVLVRGGIDAPFPMMNYPLVRGYAKDKQIVALYNDIVLTLDASRPVDKIDIVNAKGSRQVVLSMPQDLGAYRYEIRDCRGGITKQGDCG